MVKRGHRARRILKWVSMCACAAVLIAAVTSVWVHVWIYSKRFGAELYGGNVFFADFHSPVCTPQYGVSIERSRYELYLPRFTPFKGAYLDETGADEAVVPLWCLLVLAGPATALLWWRDRRKPAAHCQNCGYDLTGNVSGTCPECGAAVCDPGPLPRESSHATGAGQHND